MSAFSGGLRTVRFPGTKVTAGIGDDHSRGGLGNERFRGAVADGSGGLEVEGSRLAVNAAGGSAALVQESNPWKKIAQIRLSPF